MKLMKLLLWTFVLTIITICTTTTADNCFDTVVDKDGKIFYIDPFDKYSVFEDKKSLTSIYWDKIKCWEEKKVYSTEEYLDEIYRDLYEEKQGQQKDSSWSNALIELVLTILWCIAMRKIFVKAWKPGINSIIPIYNFYELSDIAWLQWMFSKVLICWVLWICLYFVVPLLWTILLLLCAIYGFVVNFYVARNFWWSTIASILYVIFNPIAMLILAFWNDKYYVSGQKEEIKEIAKKVQIDEIMGKEEIWNNNTNNVTTEKVDEEFDIDNSQPNNSETEEDPIKYIDSSQFT